MGSLLQRLIGVECAEASADVNVELELLLETQENRMEHFVPLTEDGQCDSDRSNAVIIFLSRICSE